MAPDNNEAHRLRWVILGALLIGTATGTLGNSLVNIALPAIMDHFAVGVGTAIWAVRMRSSSPVGMGCRFDAINDSPLRRPVRQTPPRRRVPTHRPRRV